MKLTQFALVIFVTTCISSLAAQNLELGKVSIAELQEKKHRIDTTAVAAILFEKGKVSFEYSQGDGFFVVTTVITRIKIYKKEGYDWANKNIKYYINYNSKEKVSFSDAVTYNLVDGKIEKTKLKNDGEFDENVNKYWAQKKIVMPNVKEGSVIEFKYEIKSPRIAELRDWNFQTSIPVNYSEFKTYIPEYFVYNPNQKGFIFPKVTIVKSQNSILIKSKERSGAGGFSISKTTFSEDKIEFGETITSYLIENLPAIKEEAFVNNIGNYTASDTHELTMTKYPNSLTEIYATDWESVAKKIYDNEYFGNELTKTDYFEDDINVLKKGLASPDEKIAAIFNFVKTKVKWNGYTGYSCEDGVRKAYNDKAGNVAEINLMLTAMLRYAGLTSNPVLVSTRSNGIPLFPSRTAFDYVITAVELNGGIILLDATEKYSVPNVLPLRDLNWFGRLIRKDGTSVEIDLVPKTYSIESANLNLILGADGSIDGKIRSQLTNQEALYFRQNNLVTSTDNYLEVLENKNNNIEISNYVRDNDLELEKPIVESYSFKDSNTMEIINDKIYICPMIFLAPKENPFKQDVRVYPIDFGYPVENRYNINIEIPDGYVVESLPKTMNIATGEGVCAFKYIILNQGNKIQVSITENINEAIVPADFYDILKEFFQQTVDKKNEKIVLKKI